MDAYTSALKERIGSAWEAQKHLLDTTLEEGRSLTPEEREQVERMDADLDALLAEQKRYAERNEIIEKANAFRADFAPRVEESRAVRRDPTDSEMLREMFRGERRSFESSPSMEFRALQSAGGSAIPTTFNDMVTVYLRTLSPMFRDDVVTVMNTTTGNPIVLPRLTADQAMGGTVVAEAAGISELDPTISSVTLNAYKYAIVTLWSQELGQDEVIGLEDLIARAAARELSIDIGSHLTTGTATVQPNGIVTAASAGATAAGTASNATLDTFFGPGDLIDLKFSLAAGYRSVGKWMVSSDAFAKMRKFRDNNKQFLFQPSLAAGMPNTFDGNEVIENPAMAAVASASKSVIYGDLSRYIVRRLPMRVETSSDYKFSNDQLAIKVVERVDGNLPDAVAIKYMVSYNT